MSVNAGVDPQGQTGTEVNTPEPQQQQQQQQESRAPYADYLERVPEALRGTVEPVFKDWDANVTQRFQQVHSQYGWAQPWENIAQQYDPEAVQQAVALAEALDQNPQAVVQAISEAYGISLGDAQQVAQSIAQQGQPGQQQQPGQTGFGEPEVDLFADPRWQQLEGTVGALANFILENQRAQQEQQETQQFVEHLQGLETKHGQFDWEYVIAKVAAGHDPESAVQEWHTRIGQQAQQLNNPANQPPVVMGAGGGTPSTTLNPNELSPSQVRDTVAAILTAQQKDT